MELPASSTPGPARRLPAGRLLIGAVLLVGIEAIVIARWWTGTGYVPPPFGISDAGEFTAVALPIARFLQEMAGIAVVGLLFARCWLLTTPDGPAQTHLASSTARWGWFWVASTLAWIVLTISDLMGLPVTALPGQTQTIVVVLGLSRVLAEVATLWVALAIALFGSRLTGRAMTAAALTIAAAALLPSALNGHAGHHDNSEVAVVALGVHILAAALWVGGLLALVVHLRRFPDQLRHAVPRFSIAALCCVVAVGVSGVVESVVLLEGWKALWETERGHLMLAKAAALVVLVGIGLWHRRRTVGAAASGRLLPLLQLAAGELLVMGATVGIAVVLSTTG